MISSCVTSDDLFAHHQLGIFGRKSHGRRSPGPCLQGFRMHVRCPHCRGEINLVADDSFRNVSCPSCGSTFSLLGYALTETQSGGGRTVGHFELLDRVGVGAFGVVWKARDTVLQRTVALKLPRKEQLTPDEADYFFRDARAAAQMTHPGIVSVHEIGRDGDAIYIATEFVEGATLSEWIQAHPPTHRGAAELLAKTADAVEHAHRSGVVHRDLKPSNILIDAGGNPHITDFGLAKRSVGEVTMTLDGQVLGTPAYMSPEQAKGDAHNADARSDVFSLGVILYQLLTGRLPFEGSRATLLLDIMHSDPPRPRSIRKTIPRDLETICLKCLEKNPQRRYQTATDFRDDLDRYLSGRPIKARRHSIGERMFRYASRNPAGTLKSLLAFLAGIAAASVFVLLVAVVGFDYFGSRRVARSDHSNDAEPTGSVKSTAVSNDDREAFNQLIDQNRFDEALKRLKEPAFTPDEIARERDDILKLWSAYAKARFHSAEY